jgi:tetratricopeptide (TPR) repeat protein
MGGPTMRVRVTFSSVVLISAFVQFLFSMAVSGKENEKDALPVIVNGTVHSFEEVFQLVEKSNLRYDVDVVADSLWIDSTAQDSLPTVTSDLCVRYDSGQVETYVMNLPDAIKSLLDTAEEAFKNADYAKAVSGYRRIHELYPAYSKALVLIGEAHFDSAAAYFHKGIEANFVDYQAHWFLGDALWRIGKKKEAAREITVAHVLNRNHKVLRDHLKSIRTAIGKEWKDWSYTPLCRMHRDPADSHVVKIACTLEWTTYALDKALWEFEPGYREQMLGKASDSIIRSGLEEKEALVCYLSQKDPPKALRKAVLEHWIDAVLVYEIVAPSAPSIVALQSRDEIERIADYVEKFH